jgi:hypothetical protein
VVNPATGGTLPASYRGAVFLIKNFYHFLEELSNISFFCFFFRKPPVARRADPNSLAGNGTRYLSYNIQKIIDQKFLFGYILLCSKIFPLILEIASLNKLGIKSLKSLILFLNSKSGSESVREGGWRCQNMTP